MYVPPTLGSDAPVVNDGSLDFTNVYWGAWQFDDLFAILILPKNLLEVFKLDWLSIR